VDPRILGASPWLLTSTLPDLKFTPQLSSSTYHLYDDYDKDISNPDVMPLTVEEYENIMLLLETAMTSIDAINSDLGSNEDADVDLLDILDDDLQRFDEDDPIHSSPEGFIDYFSRINIMRNQKAGRLTEDKLQERVDKWAPRGNSLDGPTRFIYHCSNRIWGCDHTNGEHRGVEEQYRSTAQHSTSGTTIVGGKIDTAGLKVWHSVDSLTCNP
jgi:hypothetical protein